MPPFVTLVRRERRAWSKQKSKLANKVRVWLLDWAESGQWRLACWRQALLHHLTSRALVLERGIWKPMDDFLAYPRVTSPPGIKICRKQWRAAAGVRNGEEGINFYMAGWPVGRLADGDLSILFPSSSSSYSSFSFPSGSQGTGDASFVSSNRHPANPPTLFTCTLHRA